MLPALTGLGDWQCLLSVEELLADILHVSVQFRYDIDETNPVFKGLVLWRKFLAFIDPVHWAIIGVPHIGQYSGSVPSIESTITSVTDSQRSHSIL